MSERKQRTAAAMREKMAAYYGYEKQHKHNKNHLTNPPHKTTSLEAENIDNHQSTWETEYHRKMRLRKIQRRLVKPNIH